MGQSERPLLIFTTCPTSIKTVWSCPKSICNLRPSVPPPRCPQLRDTKGFPSQGFSLFFTIFWIRLVPFWLDHAKESIRKDWHPRRSWSRCEEKMVHWTV